MANVIRKPQFVEQIAEKLGISKKEADIQVDAFLEVLEGNLVEGNSVQFLGHGTFEVRTRSARKGRNPQTGAEIEIAESKNVAFKAGKSLSDKVNGKAEVTSKVADKVAKKEEKKKAPTHKRGSKKK